MVKTTRAAQRGARTGIALSATELRGADLRLRDGWRASLEPPDTASGAWPSLVAALRELAATLQVTDGRLAVALMPPLTEVRRLDLPPLRDEELQRLLAKNAGRYFLSAREPQIVGAEAWRKARNSPGGVVGAAASARLVAMINAAAREAGWTVEAIVPAESGWRAAALSMWPAFARGAAHLLVHHTDRTDLIRLEDGRLAGVRRFRAGSLDAELIRGALEESRRNGTAPRVGAIGAAAPRTELVRALSGHASVGTLPSEWATSADDAAFVAASFAGTGQGLALQSEDAVRQAGARSRRMVWTIAAGAVAMLVLAALLELWGVHRELAAVRRERAALRTEIQQTLVGRSAFETTFERLGALAAIERAAPRWSNVIATVSERMDASAYLVAFRARADSLFLDGRAERSNRAYDALADAPGLANVRGAASVRVETMDDGTVMERFTLSARVVPPAGRTP